MTHTHYFAVAAALFVVACTHKAPEPLPPHDAPKISIHETFPPAPAGTRVLFQFNDEPPIIQVADGKGGPPLLYHGRPLFPEEIKSVESLNAKKAQARFGDETLSGALLIMLKPSKSKPLTR
jgi:hypothetical protein